jgi:FAD-dependent oxidoreductase domain-containing protein 1
MQMPSSRNVVIIGGAIMGSAIAWFLREAGFAGSVTVIERDPSYSRSSTALAASAIRTQFGCDINVRMSLFGASFLREAKAHFGPDADVGFMENGYLILGRPEADAARLESVVMQRSAGADIAIYEPSELVRAFPWLNTDGLGIGTFGRSSEGWFDGWSLLTLFQRGAKTRDVRYVKAEASTLVLRGGRVTAIDLTDGQSLPADVVVLAAGPGSGAFARRQGLELPVEPRKRSVFALKAPLDNSRFPMLFDTSGAWIRAEGSGFIAGMAPPAGQDPPADDDFEPHHDMVENALWPALAHRIPALEQWRIETAWAGHYEVNTLDHNGIVGPHDEIANLMFATGFSGHGLMHAPAVGRGMAELIIEGAYRTLDVSELGYARIRARQPMRENVVY